LDLLQMQHLFKQVEDDKGIANFAKGVKHFRLKVRVCPAKK
jgi:hypothetical protein